MNIALLYPTRDKHNTGVRNYTKGIISEVLNLDKENRYILSDDGYFSSNKNIFSNIKWGGSYQDQVRYDFMCYCKSVDLVHSYWNNFEGMNSKCKKVLTIHDLIPLIHPEWHTLKDYFDGPIRESAEKADLIITNSAYTKKDVIECYGVSADRIKVVYPGLLKSLSVEESNDELIHTYGLEDGFILSVSTIEPRKNLRGLINGFINFRKQHKSSKLKLVLVGNMGWDSEFYNDIDKIGEYRDQIVLTGFVSDDDLGTLYREALAFAYVSYYEGFGMPLLEAMAAGTAVISSYTTSMPEVCGDAACYCNPYDIESISDAINRIADDESYRKKLECLSVEQSQKFSFIQAAKQTIEIYRSLED